MKDSIRFTSLLALAAMLCVPAMICADDLAELPEHAILASKYMIGIVGQRDGDDKLVVQQVADDSPAEKAGVQARDIIVRFGKTSVNDILALSKAVDATGDNETDIRLIRDGKKITLKITPMKRPEEAMIPPAVNPDSIAVFYPGLLFAGKRTLPEGVEIRIVGKGDKPAKVIITTEKEKWEVAANELGKLPPKAREVLGVGATIKLPQTAWPSRPLYAPVPKVPPHIEWVPAQPMAPKYILPHAVAPEKVESQYKKLESQIKELQDAVKKLQHQHDHD